MGKIRQLQALYSRYWGEKDANEVKVGGEEIACGVETAYGDYEEIASDVETNVEVDEHELLIYWLGFELHKDQYEVTAMATYIHMETLMVSTPSIWDWVAEDQVTYHF